MKNRIIAIFAVIAVCCAVISITCGCANKKSDTAYLTGQDHLYDIAIDYLRDEYMNNEQSEKEKWEPEIEDYQVFLDYKGFGISQENDKKYAYMWVLEEEYYVVKGDCHAGHGSSMPYKIEFENDKPVNYEVPMDGTFYSSSIKEMFPDDIEDDILNYKPWEELSVDDKVKEYYSYLDSSEDDTN